MEFLVEGEPDLFLNCSLDAPNGYDGVCLTKNVQEKILPNGDVFTGEIDAVSGDLVHGIMLYKALKERYEGPFLNNMRHGNCAVCQKLDKNDAKFVGSFKDDQFHEGTLITKEFTYTGDFARGDFANPVFHGRGILARRLNETVYEGDFRENQYDGHGMLTTADGNRYDGSFSSGKKSGLGTMQYRDGSSYTGEWVLDLRHGKGVRNSANNGRIYRGDFEYDHPNGLGTLTVHDVELSGSWHQGRPVDGPGWRILYHDKGLLYKGQVKCGRPHGRGSLFKLASEDNLKTLMLFSGCFVCGLPTPRDVCIDHHSDLHDSIEVQELSRTATVGDELSELKELRIQDEPTPSSQPSEPADVTVESCQWTKSFEAILASNVPTQCPQSKLRVAPSNEESNEESSEESMSLSVTLMDGSQYVGPISSDCVMEGQASFVDSLNNSAFMGTFRDGLKDGEGEERYSDGTMYKGNFKEGWRDGMGELSRRNGKVIYHGEWKNDMHHGQGVRIYDNVHPGTYRGDFQVGQRHGRGALTTADGTMYEGDWCNGLPQFGDWVITYPSQTVYLGYAIFVDNKSPPVPMGFGSRREPDGTFYTGNFLNGQRDGQGVCLLASGETWDGKWEKDKFIDHGRASPTAILE